MGVLYDCFVAQSDEDAARVLDEVAGPSLDELSGNGIDPVVLLGTLESLLTGRPYETLDEDARWGHLVASADDGERLVVTVTDGLTSALTKASESSLSRVAHRWSQAEEFWGTADPDDLAQVLSGPAGLARQAQQTDSRLYCWVCV